MRQVGWGNALMKRIVVATDGSDGGNRALDTAAQLAKATGSPLVIIDFEHADDIPVEVHVPESDPTINANDHADHMLTARAARDAADGLPARWLHHVGYASASLPEDLPAEDRAMKCAVYAVTLAAVLALDNPVSWQHYDRLFVGRSYCRVEDRK
jgi:Universal stress protein family